MYRGDDIYLFDYWPLDNLNTVGAGATYGTRGGTTFALHTGLVRLDSCLSVRADRGAGARVGRADDGGDGTRPAALGQLSSRSPSSSARPSAPRSPLYGELHLLPDGQIGRSVHAL